MFIPAVTIGVPTLADVSMWAAQAHDPTGISLERAIDWSEACMVACRQAAERIADEEGVLAVDYAVSRVYLREARKWEQLVTELVAIYSYTRYLYFLAN
jgi:hypothetical protein